MKEAMVPPGCDEGVWENFCYVALWPWNFINMLIPPTTLLYGWATFVVALGCTGFVTAMISDLANLFGCVLGLSAEITAITFVALGTSVPDTFASRIAIRQDSNADAAITNVTGSNSVNVFLGLGLSWGISSIYWAFSKPTARWQKVLAVHKATTGNDVIADYEDKWGKGLGMLCGDGVGQSEGPGCGKAFFFVDAGNLGFSVTVFSVCSLIAFAILHYQKKSGGELGGPNRYKMGGAFVTIWLIFLVMSGLKSEGHI